MAVSLSTPNRPLICHCDRPRGHVWCYVCGGNVPTLSAKQVMRGKPKKPAKTGRPA